MTVSGSGHHRLKDFNRLNEGNPITVQHMPDGKIAFHQQVGLRKLSGKVKVTHLPCPMSGFPLIGGKVPEDPLPAFDLLRNSCPLRHESKFHV